MSQPDEEILSMTKGAAVGTKRKKSDGYKVDKLHLIESEAFWMLKGVDSYIQESEPEALMRLLKERALNESELAWEQ